MGANGIEVKGAAANRHCAPWQMGDDADTMRSALLAFCSLVLAASSARADLFSFVAKPEPEATWSIASKTDLGTCEVVSS